MQFFRLPERAGITEKTCQIVAARCQIRQIGIRIFFGEFSKNLQRLLKKFFCLLERAGIVEKSCQIVAACCQIRQIGIRFFLDQIPINL